MKTIWVATQMKDLPNTCVDCDLVLGEQPDDDAYCSCAKKANGKMEYNNPRPQWCPLYQFKKIENHRVHTMEEIDELMRTAAKIKPQDCGGKHGYEIANELYMSPIMFSKWKAGSARLSLNNFDNVLRYFQEVEPQRLEMAKQIIGWED